MHSKKTLQYITGACMLLSIFLPWYSVHTSGSFNYGDFGQSSSMKVSVNGLQGDNAMFGFLALILTGVGLFATYRPIKTAKFANLIAGGASIVLSALLLFHLVGATTRFNENMNINSSLLSSNVDFGIRISNGFGLYLLLIASCLFTFFSYDKSIVGSSN